MKYLSLQQWWSKCPLGRRHHKRTGQGGVAGIQGRKVGKRSGLRQAGRSLVGMEEED